MEWNPADDDRVVEDEGDLFGFGTGIGSANSERKYPLPILNADDTEPLAHGNNTGNSKQPPRGGKRGRGRRGGFNDITEMSFNENRDNEDSSRLTGRGRTRGRRGGGRNSKSRGGRHNSPGRNNVRSAQMNFRRFNSVDNISDEVSVSGNFPKSSNYTHSRSYSRERQRDGNSQEASNCDSQARQPKRDRIFGFRKLQEHSISTQPDNVAMELITGKSGFQTLLQKEAIQRDWLILIVDVLSIAFQSKLRSCLLSLAHMLSKEKFLTRHILPFLNGICTSMVNLNEKKPFILKTCNLMKDIMQRIPDEAVECNLAIALLPTICQFDPNLSSDNCLLQEITALSDMKNALLKDMETKRQEQANDLKQKRTKDPESIQPPDDFRELSVLPKLKDLHFYEKPFLRANKIQGRYNDLQHYLDVQFRLLREDYMQPLRNGILEYRREREHGNIKKKIQDIRLYYKVQVIRPLCTNRGILHMLQFDMSKMRHIKWDSSRRLLHGSLLCLSQDDFETVLFATVSNRDTRELEKGNIQVQFQDCISEVLELKSNVEFIMAETTAYFEAYRHILQGLQETKDELPLQRYIVNCEQTVKPPKYILKSIGKTYDFAPILKQTLNDVHDYNNVPVINTRFWPTAAEMELDESQYKALQMAITREFALIQGPPGTGKTFVGLKIAELLLHNKEQWQDFSSSSPILVVCYTNHALDQFVEGIAQFSDSIVRIGGRCKNPVIEPFMMRNLRKDSQDKKSISRTVHERKRDCKQQMYQLRTAIENVGVRLQVSRMGIVTENILEQFMKISHFESLLSRSLKNVMGDWLLLSSASSSSQGEKTTSEQEGMLFLRWEEEILKNVPCGLENMSEADDITDLWDIDLLDRAGIYYFWIDAYRVDLMRKLKEIEENITLLNKTFNEADNKHLTVERKSQMELQHAIEHSYVSIISEDLLLRYAPSSVRRQVKRLVSEKPSKVKHECPIVIEWLCLRRDSLLLPSIIQALTSIQESDTVDVVGEVEAENMARNLDDDSDDEDVFSKTRISLNNNTDILIEKQLVMSFDDVQGSRTDDSEWISTKPSKSSKIAMRQMLSFIEPFSEKREQSVKNVWDLPIESRFSLYKLWLSRYQDSLRESVKEREHEYSQMCLSYQEVLDAEDAEIISSTNVVAMTTTGAAKYRNILLSVKPQIIIVEEAAEVLESHIVTSINENCQHLILIGDHKQLRPTPTVYNLAVRYNLEISLFERMIKNEMTFVTLALQHRMRPEISAIIRHIYPNLKDDESVLKHPKVLGVDQNMFYIDHTHPEVSHEETHSKSNAHEAEYMTSLCRYLINQGYKTTQITVLTTYMGQMILLKKHMPRKDFEGIRITVVDNFQGEENDIILLSLVRSNNNDSVGFLKIENRICVALSRARIGFFVIGNFSLLVSQSNLWAQITETLRQQNKIGSALMLRCQNHSGKTILASKKSDFEQSPNGGCMEICDTRLQCGHVCEQFCHIADKEHKLFKCFKKCEKILCSQGHKCSKPCFRKCGECQEKVMKILPICKHQQECPCSKDPHLMKCKTKCDKKLVCGHVCKGLCGDCTERGRHETKCPELMERTLICGHVAQCKCSDYVDTLRCIEPCCVELDCGHKCTGTCSDCNKGRLHVQCLKKCNRSLVCGHRCGQSCGVPCQFCDKSCRNRCSHSTCKQKCGQKCISCTMPCAWKCMHSECKKLCGEMCDKLPCDNRCSKTFEKCKHQCVGLCGEICPPICNICNKDKLKIICPNSTIETTFIKLENCGHIVDTVTMDQWMRNEDVSPSVQIKLKSCPIPGCNQAILNSHRYNNIVKIIKNDIEKVKKLVQGDPAVVRRRYILLKRQLQNLNNIDTTNTSKLLQRFESLSDTLDLGRLTVVENQLTLLQGVHCLLSLLNKEEDFRDTIRRETREELVQLRTWIMKSKYKPNKNATEFQLRDRTSFSAQELKEVEAQLKRYTYITKLLLVANETQRSGNHAEYVMHMDKYIKEYQEKMFVDWSKESIADKLIQSFGKGIAQLDGIKSSYLLKQAESAQTDAWLKCQEGGHVFSVRTHGNDCPSCKTKIEKALTERTNVHGVISSKKSFDLKHNVDEESFKDKKSEAVTKERPVYEEHGQPQTEFLLKNNVPRAGRFTPFSEDLERRRNLVLRQTNEIYDLENASADGVTVTNKSSYALKQMEPIQTDAWSKCREGHVFSVRTHGNECPQCKKKTEKAPTVRTSVEGLISSEKSLDSKPYMDEQFKEKNWESVTKKRPAYEEFIQHIQTEVPPEKNVSRPGRFTSHSEELERRKLPVSRETKDVWYDLEKNVSPHGGRETSALTSVYYNLYSQTDNSAMDSKPTEKMSLSYREKHSSMRRAQVAVGQDNLVTQQGETDGAISQLPITRRKENSSGATAEPTCIKSGCLNPQSKGMSRLCMDHFLIEQHAIMDKIKQRMNKE